MNVARRKQMADSFWVRADQLILACSPMESIIFESGTRAWLTSTDGRRYLDLGSGQVCALFGHSPEPIVDAIATQAARLMHLPSRFASVELVRAAEAVFDVVPSGFSKVAFLTTGTEANEFAIRLAKLATQRTTIAAPQSGYLGTSHLMRELSTSFVDDVARYPRPRDCFRFDWGGGALDTESAVLKARESLDPIEGLLAAVIAEPILGAHGIMPLPDGFLYSMKKYLADAGALLIVDEAQTGLGRTGDWFAFQHEDVMPDILVFSKCAGSGYPLACVVVSDEVARRVSESGFFYLSSHQSDPLSLAALIATLREAQRIDAPRRSRRLGRRLMEELRRLCDEYSVLSHVTGRGLLLGLHCHNVGANSASRISRRIFQAALQHKVIFGYGDWAGTLLLAPPLCIDEEDLEFAIDALTRACREVEAECRSGDLLPRWRNPPAITARFLDGLRRFHKRGNGD